MAELRTEEEQIEAIKRWWKKNGSSLLLGIALALAIVFGWQAWQNHQAGAQTSGGDAGGQRIDELQEKQRTAGLDVRDKGRPAVGVRRHPRRCPTGDG